MDKFYVYVIQSGEAVKRVYVNEIEVKAIFQRTKDSVQVIRSMTNQIAVVVEDRVLWQDIGDTTLKDAAQ